MNKSQRQIYMQFNKESTPIAKLLGVKQKKHESVDSMLYRFKQIIKDSELFIEIYDRMSFKKPSELRRKQQNLAKLRNNYKNVNKKHSK